MGERITLLDQPSFLVTLYQLKAINQYARNAARQHCTEDACTRMLVARPLTTSYLYTLYLLSHLGLRQNTLGSFIAFQNLRLKSLLLNTSITFIVYWYFYYIYSTALIIEQSSTIIHQQLYFILHINVIIILSIKYDIFAQTNGPITTQTKRAPFLRIPYLSISF